MLRTVKLGVLALSCCLAACSGYETSSGDEVTANVPARLSKVDASVSCDDIERAIDRAPVSDNSSPYYGKLLRQRSVCSLNNKGLNIGDATAALGDNNLSVSLDEDVLTIFAKSGSDDAPHLCCSIQKTDWRNLSENERVWGTKFRIERPKEAMLMFMDTSGLSETSEPIYIRGKDAPPDGPFLSDPKIKLAGQTIETKLESPQLRETRALTLYIPPKDSINGDIPFIVMADGRSVAYYARRVEPMITAGQIAPIALVGIHSGNRSISNPQTDLPDDTRTTDYLPGVSEKFPDRFDNHLAFVTDTVIPKMRSKYGLSSDRNDIAVAGQSNGAVFAMYAALERPDVFGSAIITSPGFGTLKSAPSDTALKSKMFFSAGLYEPEFLKSAQNSAKILKENDFRVHETWNAAGHGSDQTTAMLYKHIPIIFPPEP